MKQRLRRLKRKLTMLKLLVVDGGLTCKLAWSPPCQHIQGHLQVSTLVMFHRGVFPINVGTGWCLIWEGELVDIGELKTLPAWALCRKVDKALCMVMLLELESTLLCLRGLGASPPPIDPVPCTATGSPTPQSKGRVCLASPALGTSCRPEAASSPKPWTPSIVLALPMSPSLHVPHLLPHATRPGSKQIFLVSFGHCSWPCHYASFAMYPCTLLLI